MPANVGITNPLNLTTNEIIFPVYEYTREIFFSDAPLFLGLPRLQCSANRFNMGATKVRARTYTLAVALADGVGTTVSLNDASSMQVGDVLQLNTGERVEVTGDPTITNATTGAGTVPVRRGVEGTTGAAQTISTPVILIGNSRTGGEIDQSGTRQFPVFIQQNVQTFQYPVQVAGLTAAMDAVVTAAGGNLVDDARNVRLQEMVRDVEHSMLYGIGEYNAGAGRTKMVGIRQILSANVATNFTSSPTNAGTYTPTDLFRDVFQPIINAQGRPDTLLVSPAAAACFTRWGWARAFITPNDPGAGINTQSMYVPLLGRPVNIVLDPQLRGTTFVGLETMGAPGGGSSARVRYVRQESWNPRASRGDAIEGEWLGDFAVDLTDPTHHAWVEGITAFATP